jgi:hypothetical protein
LAEIALILECEIQTRKVNPISDPKVVAARQDFAKDFYRKIVPRRVLEPGQSQQQSLQMIQRPNLAVPVGDEFVYLAQ